MAGQRTDSHRVDSDSAIRSLGVLWAASSRARTAATSARPTTLSQRMSEGGRRSARFLSLRPDAFARGACYCPPPPGSSAWAASGGPGNTNAVDIIEPAINTANTIKTRPATGAATLRHTAPTPDRPRLTARPSESGGGLPPGPGRLVSACPVPFQALQQMVSRSAGKRGSRRDGGTTSWPVTCSSVSITDSPRNGGRPVTIS